MTENEKPEDEKKSLFPIVVNVTWTTALVLLSVIGGVGTGAYFIGRTMFDKEKSDYYEEIKNLKAINNSKNDSLVVLNKELSECNTTINYLKNHKSIQDTLPDNSKNKSANNKKKTGTNSIKKNSSQGQKKEAKPQPDSNSAGKRIDQLLTQLDYFEKQNKNLIEENDNLKSSISLMRQKLQRARELEKNRKIESDNVKKSTIEKQRDDIISSVEKTMEGLVPEIPKSINESSNIEPTKQIQKVIDYEKLGDENFKKAYEYEQNLKTQPDTYFIGLIPNKTKKDFIQFALKEYQSALINYQNANLQDKITLTETKIKDFKKFFGL